MLTIIFQITQRFRAETCWRIRSTKQARGMAGATYAFEDSSSCSVRPNNKLNDDDGESPRLTIFYSELLTLEEKDPKRLFEGNALIRRLVRVGVLDESRMKLDYVLALKIEDFLERRLQTCVYKLGLAKSIHHARVLIRQRHIR